eukprot:1144908-Pelagomonas_calceolata.AAC.5
MGALCMRVWPVISAGLARSPVCGTAAFHARTMICAQGRELAMLAAVCVQWLGCAACPAGKAAEPFEVLGTGPWASGPQAPQWDQPDQPQTSSSSQPRINPPAQEPSLQQQQPMNESGSSSSSSSGSGSESCPFHLPLIEWGSGCQAVAILVPESAGSISG